VTSIISIRTVEREEFEGRNTLQRMGIVMREMGETLCLSQLSSTDILGTLPREAKMLETHKTGIVMSIERTRYQRLDIETVTVKDKYTKEKFSEMVPS